MIMLNQFSYQMKKYLIAILFILFVAVSLHAADVQKVLWVGASETDVNPPPGAFIAGHTLNRRFNGIHDSLYAKAVIVSDRINSVVIVTVDCIGLLYPQLQSIRELVAQQLQDPAIPPSHIVLSSTHTHAGPDVVGLWGPDRMHTGVDSVYIKALVSKCALQVIKAKEAMQPVFARYAVTTFGHEWVYNISQPEQLDRSLTVLQFLNGKGETVATLTNFACHPTIVDGVHDKVSADYPSGFYRKMKASLGGVHLFLQGSIGGWVQPEYEVKTFEQALFRGEQMADTVLNALLQFHELQNSSITYTSKQFEMPVSNPGFKMLSEAGVISRNIEKGTLCEIAWFSIGEAMFATHPGETIPAMGKATKELMRTNGPKFIMGLSMDALGYILSPDFFDPSKKIPHAPYLCSMSVGPEAMPLIMDVLRELASQK
jgi:hypothetical protein